MRASAGLWPVSLVLGASPTGRMTAAWTEQFPPLRPGVGANITPISQTRKLRPERSCRWPRVTQPGELGLGLRPPLPGALMCAATAPSGLSNDDKLPPTAWTGEPPA